MRPAGLRHTVDNSDVATRNQDLEDVQPRHQTMIDPAGGQ